MKFILFLCLFGYLGLLNAAWTIVIPHCADPETINAAGELKIHLDKALTAAIPIVRENKNISGNKIYLGDTLFARKAGVKFSEFPAEKSLIQKSGQNIILGGGVPRGVLYSAYEFLERFAEVSWLDPYVTVNPKLTKLDIPEGTRLEIQPSFRFRGVFTMTLSTRKKENFYRNLRWRSRMRENIFWNEKFTPAERNQWGITPVLGRPAPLNTLYYYSREWPKTGMEDLFSLDKSGERLRATSVFGPGHICFSSLKARKTFAKQMLNYIAQDRKEFPKFPPVLYNLSINDTPKGYCICKGCLALENKYKAYSGAMLEFVNYVAGEVNKRYPDVTIQTSAYFFAEKPPVGIKPASNVTVRVSPLMSKLMLPLDHKLNRTPMKNLQGWHKIGKIQIWNYWINYVTPTTNLGIVNVDTIYRNMQIFKKNGSDYVFSECEKNDLTTFHPLRMYIGLQMKRDCTQKLEVLLDRFFKGYYGNAAGPMRLLYEYIKLRQEEHPDRNHNEKYFPFHDGDFFRFAEKCFAQADKLAGKDKELLDRISLEKVPVDLLRLSLKDTLQDTRDLPALSVVHARLAVNWQKSINRWWNDVGYRPTVEKNAMLIKLTPAQFGSEYPLPPELRNRKVFDANWKVFTSIRELRDYGLRLENDPEACGGKTMTLGKITNMSGAYAKVKNKHARPMNCGIRSRDQKKTLLVHYPKPADEKFHLYYLGRTTLTPNSVFWAHDSWGIQLTLERYYRKGLNNTFDIYVSLRLEGPSYVKGSQKEDKVSVDRILLALAE